LEIKGWEEIDADLWVDLPLHLKATITFNGPYKVIYIAESEGLNKIKQENAKRTSTETAEDQPEGKTAGNSDNDSQHEAESENDGSE